MLKTSDIIAKFRSYLLTERCVSRNTYISYSTDLDQFEQFLQRQKIELSEVNSAHLKIFLHELHAAGTAARSVARKISTIKGLFAYMSSRLDMANTWLNIPMPKVAKSLPHYLSLEEIEALFAAAARSDVLHAQRNKMMLLLLYVSGMRVSELVSLTVNNLDAYRHVICVDGKGDKQRIIPLPNDIFVQVLSYANGARKEFLTAHHAESDYLFPVIYGKKINHISRQSCWTLLNDIWKMTGSSKAISPHQLRHSLATHMLARGVNLRSLQLLLGHEQISTVQIYTHVDVSHLRAVYDKKHPRS